MLYPMTFKPILKKIIWGGSDICPFKGITPVQEGIGESWELSHVEGNYSVVDNGALEGKTLDELIRTYGKQLLGEKVVEQFGSIFPLLIKFIDARDNLSIQVHPDDEVNPGDVFFLPAGRVHAIGAGCFIAEIQQTSNITYRIYDYDRKGPDGKGRELHTELAKDAIDYTLYPDYRTHYKAHTNATVELAACKYFTTNLLDVDTIMVRDFSELDSFVVYICMEGKASIRDNKGNEIYIHQGQTVLIPADTDVVTISPVPGAKFMETYIG